MTITLSNAKIRDLLNAHNQLDGTNEVVESGAQKTVVRRPYTFSGKTIYNITKNIRILRVHVETANKDRDKVLETISEGINEIDADKEPLKARAFAKGVGAIEDDEVTVEGLLMLKIADILNDDLVDSPKGDKTPKKIVNPIPQTTLASLAPVLDMFNESVSG